MPHNDYLQAEGCLWHMLSFYQGCSPVIALISENQKGGGGIIALAQSWLC